MQLCMVRDDRGWQRGLACRRSFDPTGPGQSTVFPRLRPNGAATRGCSVVGLRANNLQPCGQFQSNGTGQTIYSLVDSFSRTGPRDAVQPRSNGTVALRQRGSISSNQVRRAASVQRCCAAPSMQLCFVRSSPQRSFAQHAMTRCRCVHWMMPQFRTCSA